MHREFPDEDENILLLVIFSVVKNAYNRIFQIL